MSRYLVGRERELATLRAGPFPATFIHGPGGIGKTSLMAEVAEGRRVAGERVHWVDGRDHAGAQAACAEALAQLGSSGSGLLVLDTYEEASALGALVRRELPPMLDRGVRLLIAGRRPPEPEWADADWADLINELALGPLGEKEARALLARRDVAGEIADAALQWGEGHPLSLAVLADVVAGGGEIDLVRLDADAMLASTLIRRVARDELKGADRQILAVASIAHAVDSRLLGAVLPGTDGDQGVEWLRNLSFSEPLGTRVTLHARMRSAIRAELVGTDRLLEQDLRRRIADHLYARAILGELTLIADIAELISDPIVRWGIAPPPATYTAERPRPGEGRLVGAALGADEEPWWPGAERWFEEAPECALVIRGARDEIVGWAICATPASAPGWSAEDPVLGPWLEHAKRVQPDGDVLMMRDGGAIDDDLESLAGSPVISCGNYRAIMLSGLRTIRRVYAPSLAGDARARAFLEAMGYERTPELDASDNGREIECHIRDNGPGGIPRFFRDVVYRDLGLPVVPAGDEMANGSALTTEAVREALRSFHDPVALARSPLALGASPEERARTVQELLRNAIAAAFGDSKEEQLQRATIERAYLDANGGHAQACRELHMSRTTYFRRLAAASARVSTYVESTSGLTA